MANARRQSNDTLDALIARIEALENKYMASATKSSGTFGANAIITGWDLINPSDSAFNPTTGIYTVRSAGDYMFEGGVELTTGTALPIIIKNGSGIISGTSAGGRCQITGTLRNLIVGDQIALISGTGGTIANIAGTRFNIWKIK